MSTSSTATLNALAADLTTGPARMPGATLSGIVGDAAHSGRGYHISREDLWSADDYSQRLWIDKQGPSDRAAAIDASMPTSSMVAEWSLWLAVFNDPNHPARTYVREYIGWNGVGSAEKLDFATGVRSVADDSHKWHSHRSIYRAYVNDPEMRRVVAETNMGRTAAQIRGDDVPVPAPGPSPTKHEEEETMVIVFAYAAATATQTARWGLGIVSGGEKMWFEAGSQNAANAYALRHGINQSASVFSQSEYDVEKAKFTNA